MTQVDFYVAEGAPLGALNHIAARLCIKAMAARKDTWVRTAPDQDINALIDYFWGFTPTSFIACAPVGEREDIHPVRVGSEPPSLESHVVINLANTPVPGTFDRIIEIVVDDDALKASRRDAWVFYKNQGFNARRTEINVKVSA